MYRTRPVSYTHLPIEFKNKKDRENYLSRIQSISYLPDQSIRKRLYTFVTCSYAVSYTHLLQSDGDPDHDPIHILTGFCQAVAISVTFLGLYTPLVNIFETFTKAILTAIGSKGEIEAIKDQFLLTLFGNGITTVLLLIIFLIIIFLIYIQIIKNGAELMVLKFAIPLLSVGLMDSDGGSFKIAGKKFLQMGFTCTLQIILLRLAMALLLTGHLILSLIHI